MWRRPQTYATALLLALAVLSWASPAAAETLAEGSWTKKSFAIEGSWKIVEEGGRSFVVLSDDFKTKKAPDLKIFLSNKPLPELNGKNATDGALLVAPLEGPKGAQRLAIPPGTDLGAFQTLILHCEKYSKLWGGAAL